MKLNIRHCYTMSGGVERKIRIAKGKKTREIKRQKIINKNIIASIQSGWIPNFSYHSLERISERIAPKSKDTSYVIVQNQKLLYNRTVGWITPKATRRIRYTRCYGG